MITLLADHKVHKKSSVKMGNCSPQRQLDLEFDEIGYEFSGTFCVRRLGATVRGRLTVRY